MSPEQAEGKKVDARTDVFSFGAVLYEMVTGQRAFQGDTRISTLSAILHKEPTPLHKIVEGAPPDLERLIAYCLRKDPSQRMHSMEDVRLLLEDVREAEQQTDGPGSGGLRGGTGSVAMVLASALAGRTGGVGTGLAALSRAGPLFLPAHAVRNRGRPGERAGLVAGRQDSRLCRRGQWRQADSYTQPGCAGRNARHQLVLQLQLSFLVAGWKPPLLCVPGGQPWICGDIGIFGRSGRPEGCRNLPRRSVTAASLSPDGKTLVFSRGARGATGLWIASPPEAEPRLYRQAPFPERRHHRRPSAVFTGRVQDRHRHLRTSRNRRA